MPIGRFRQVLHNSMKNPCAANKRRLSQVQKCNDAARKSVERLGRRIADLDENLGPMMSGNAVGMTPKKK